jgi:Family of unknown function (DUF6263)
MFSRAAIASLMLGLALTGPAFAQVKLTWKFKEGDVLFVEEKVVGKTTVTVMGNTSTEEQAQHRLSRFLVKSTSRDDIVLEQRIEWWKFAGGQGGSQDDNKLLEKLCKDIVFTIHLSTKGGITRFEGYEAFLTKLAAYDGAEASKLKAVAGEDVFRAPLVQIFDTMPAVAVKAGDRWERVSMVPMGPLGNFKLATVYTYSREGDGGQQIDIKAALSFSSGTADPGELGFKILKLDLTKKEATGKLVFDNVKGRLVLQELTLPLAGTMVMELMGMQVEVGLEGTETRTIRMLSKRP